MTVELTQPDIETAIKEHLNKNGVDTTGKHVDISVTAGRKPGGLRASVNITAAPVAAEEPANIEEVVEEPIGSETTTESTAEPEDAATAGKAIFGNNASAG